MEEKIKEFEAYRASVCKKANILLLTGILLIISAFGLTILLENPIFILLAVLGIICIVINSSIKGKVSLKFKNEFIIDLVKETYPGCVYNLKGGIEIGSIMEPRLFKGPDKYFVEDYLKSSYDGVAFEMCDFDFQERRITTDSKGHTTTTYVTYAKGRFMIFDYKREFNQVLKVVENDYLSLSTRGLEKIETESVDFNKKFKVYTSNSLTAFYVLTPQIQLKLLELESLFRGSIYLAYMNGKLYVAICDNVDILDVDASEKITLETLEILKSQLLLPASIINELGLSSDKFQQGDAI